jgi:hypothetical protein
VPRSLRRACTDGSWGTGQEQAQNSVALDASFAPVIANRLKEGCGDEYAAYESSDHFRNVRDGAQEHHHGQRDDCIEGPVLQVTIRSRVSRSTSMMVKLRTNIAPTPRPIAMMKRLFDSAKAPITPSKLKLASRTSRERRCGTGLHDFAAHRRTRL